MSPIQSSVSNHFNIKIDNKADFKGYCYTGGICDTNGYAIETPDGWILIDAPEGFIDFMKPYNVDIKLLMLTHQHFDHVLEVPVSVLWSFESHPILFMDLSRIKISPTLPAKPIRKSNLKKSYL